MILAMSRAAPLIALAASLGIVVPATLHAAAAEYRVQFLVRLNPGDPVAEAHIRVLQPDSRLKRLRLRMPAEAFSQIKADGRLARSGQVLTWTIPSRGGELSYRVVVAHQRNDKGYDAYVADRWALFRADDVFPSADAVLRVGAEGRSELLLNLPPGWSGLTPYPADPAGRLRIEGGDRSFERPVGWILAGQIGSRMDVIGPTVVRVAAPREQPAPRVPVLALLRWTLPTLQAEIPRIPPYLLIVMAGEPMWRGGLSAPNSLYSHAGRPLLSENGTSTLVHELIHVLAPVPATPEHDWIDEGIAEYLGLVVLSRSGTISPERFQHAVDVFRRRGAGVRNMVTRYADGAVKARAVAVFAALDSEIQKRSNGQRDIFDLVRRLMQESQPADLDRLRALALEIAGPEPLASLAPSQVPTP